LFTSLIRVNSKQKQQNTQPVDASDGYGLKNEAINFVKEVYFQSVARESLGTIHNDPAGNINMRCLQEVTHFSEQSLQLLPPSACCSTAAYLHKRAE
jgi:hypothetical protein